MAMITSTGLVATSPLATAQAPANPPLLDAALPSVSPPPPPLPPAPPVPTPPVPLGPAVVPSSPPPQAAKSSARTPATPNAADRCLMCEAYQRCAERAAARPGVVDHWG